MTVVTVRTAAERLGVAYSTLKRWVHTGRVRTTRTEGGHHRVSEAEIERLMARHQPDAALARPAPPDESIGGLSARNRLHGFIDEVRIDGLLAQVRLRVGDQSLTAVTATMRWPSSSRPR
jgi:excisionase family DNA binding protein